MESQKKRKPTKHTFQELVNLDEIGMVQVPENLEFPKNVLISLGVVLRFGYNFDGAFLSTFEMGATVNAAKTSFSQDWTQLVERF